jgi:SPP1 gp7 family putative phage head morphogenesis protein
MDDTLGSQARILTNSLTQKFNDLFASFAKPIADKVSEEANKTSSISVHSSIKAMSENFTINPSSLSKNTLDILNATTTENVALIKSISQQYLSGVQQAVMRSITTGGGLQDLIPYLQKSKEITYRRARFIAYDQTRKAFNNLSTIKMQNLGLDEYEWLHTGGSNHPRKLHIELSGQIFSFAKPPIIADNGKGNIIRGNPGELPGCRCRKRIIMRLKNAS